MKSTLRPLFFLSLVLTAVMLSPAPLLAQAAPASGAPQLVPGMPLPFSNEQLLEQAGWILAKRSQVGDLALSQAELEALLRGVSLAAANKDIPYDHAKVGQSMEALIGQRLGARKAAQLQANRTQQIKFFAELDQKPAVKSLPSGLRYEIVAPGAGDHPKPTDTVLAHYTGTLLDGRVFDASGRHGPNPAKFSLSGVIRGWTEGVPLIAPGGKIRLYIPSDLAYGDNSSGPIPPGSALIFDIELVAVEGAPAPAKAP